VVVREAQLAETQAVLEGLGQAGVRAVSQVPASATLVMECAGHSAIAAHVLPALQRGVECALLSIGALSERGLAESLEAAALQGGGQAHLLAGAIGGIDAIAAARLAGLSTVTYTGRKPPGSWAAADLPPEESKKNTAETSTRSPQEATDSIAINQPADAKVVFAGTAREAARRFPKNANVAATVALAGLGLDATQVRLLADASVSENIHEIHAQGAFGELLLQMRGKPLPDNPKTSALTVLSALRFLHNRAAAVTL
jgi:aspartate dehydrogenase